MNYYHTKDELKNTVSGKVLPHPERIEKEIAELMKARSKVKKKYDDVKGEIGNLEKALSQFETYLEMQKEKPDRRKSPDELE